MGNILDYNEKRIYELSEIELSRITDNALLVISQDSLTRSINLGVLRQAFTAGKNESVTSDKFLTANAIYKELDNIEKMFISNNETLSEFNTTLSGFSETLSDVVLDLDGKIEVFNKQFAEFIDFITNEETGEIPHIKIDIENFKNEMRNDFAILRKDTNELIDGVKDDLQYEIDGVYANLSYIYAYGPVVPTLLPEGKIFLQTFNVNYKNEDPQFYTKQVTGITSGEVKTETARILVEAVGMKIAKLTLILPELNQLPSQASSIKVTLMDEHALDKTGLIIYESLTSSLSKDSNGYYHVEMGTFMIPTTSTTLEITLGAGVYDEPTKVSFNHYDDGIWETVGGIIVIPLTAEITDPNTKETYTAYLINEEGDYLSASGSSDENPKNI